MKITVCVKSQRQKQRLFSSLHFWLQNNGFLFQGFEDIQNIESIMTSFVSLVFDCLVSLLLSQAHKSKREIKSNIGM